MYQNQNNPQNQQNAQQASSGSSRSGRTVVPEAKGALNQMKYEIASELGINLKQGYNGDLPSRQAGYIGGYMTKRLLPGRRSSSCFSAIFPVTRLIVSFITSPSARMSILSMQYLTKSSVIIAGLFNSASRPSESRIC